MKKEGHIKSEMAIYLNDSDRTCKEFAAAMEDASDEYAFLEVTTYRDLNKIYFEMYTYKKGKKLKIEFDTTPDQAAYFAKSILQMVKFIKNQTKNDE